MKKTPARTATGKTAARGSAKAVPATSQVLQELKSLAKELNLAAKGLGKRNATDPKVIAAILGNVERMMSEAADKSLAEAESAKQVIASTRDSLGKDWARRDIEASLSGISGHLTNIIVAQEFQDLAGQAIRKAMKALVGAIVVEAAADDGKLSQNEVDSLLKGLMP
jgi:chemotaxis regulatin CheY-phosphate phosphatase CheZ